MRVSSAKSASTVLDRESVRAASTNRPRVLIIDPDCNFIDLVSKALARNFIIVGARDVADINKLRRASQLDILVIDLSMPTNDGIEVIREIRKNRSLSRIPLLALSTSTALRCHLMSSDVIAVLPKGRWLEEIARSLMETLGQSAEKSLTRSSVAAHRRGDQDDGKPIQKTPIAQGARQAA